MQPLLKGGATELHTIAEVWSLVGMDLVGSLKKTHEEKLTMTCYFCKWVHEALAVPEKSAHSRSVLGQILTFEVASEECVRILHSGGNHWITITTVMKTPPIV